MKTFGIISEGPTDQAVVENIVIGFFNNEDDIRINFLQPLRDATDEQATKKFGGWYKVFEYCGSQYFIDAFEQNDYLVIQIDTDRSEELNYDVKQSTQDGTKLTPAELIEAVIAKFEAVFTNTLGGEKFDLVRHRIIYAVCVNEIECWLLPLYFDDKTKQATNNCTHKLNPKITEKFGFYIDANNKSNMVSQYGKMSKDFLKHKILTQKHSQNISLQIFIQKLAEKGINLTAE